MKIAVLKERRAHETRVAASPDTVAKFVDLGIEVQVEKGAGASANMPDAAYREAGGAIASSVADALADADIVLKVRRPMMAGEDFDELSEFSPGQTLVCQVNALTNRAFVAAMAQAGLTGFAMEMMPRISRAQSMDILSSQANLAGYKAVVDAAAEYGRAFPMMMTAAGTVPPAKVLVMGTGVAGLQAIATARRLGGVVSATDVRPATKSEVESLGAKFIAVEDEEFAAAQTEAGYAKEMSGAYKAKQAALIAETIAKQDIVICTALIPGRTAPILVDGLDRQVAFLAKLVHEQSSKALIFHRRQSMARPGAGPLDVYEIVTAGGEHWDELLVDGYAPAGEAPPRPPPGYIFRRQMAVESRPEPNRGDNRHHRDSPLAFLHPDEAPEHHRRPHRPKVWMFDST